MKVQRGKDGEEKGREGKKENIARLGKKGQRGKDGEKYTARQLEGNLIDAHAHLTKS